jgi:hypothetical protein
MSSKSTLMGRASTQQQDSSGTPAALMASRTTLDDPSGVVRKSFPSYTGATCPMLKTTRSSPTILAADRLIDHGAPCTLCSAAATRSAVVAWSMAAATLSPHPASFALPTNALSCATNASAFGSVVSSCPSPLGHWRRPGQRGASNSLAPLRSAGPHRLLQCVPAHLHQGELDRWACLWRESIGTGSS